MDYTLSANSIRVYKSRLRKLTRVLPLVTNIEERTKIATEIVALETKLGVKGEDIRDDKPGRKPAVADISAYNERLVNQSLAYKEEESESHLERIQQLANQERAGVRSSNAIQLRKKEIKVLIPQIHRAKGEERQVLKARALLVNNDLPDFEKMTKEITDADFWSVEAVDERAKELLTKTEEPKKEEGE
jgi:hypothetical protein